MHEPVLVNEVLDLLDIKEGGAYIDGTLGNGGHALAILKRAGSKGRLLGIDRDEEAIARARKVLAGHTEQCTLVHGNHAEMAGISKQYGFENVDGVLLDLGVSSEQLESPERGFSFSRSGPLDMRMDRSEERTAADLVAELAEDVLCGVLRENGDERNARRIARAIVRARSSATVKTTQELSDIIVGAVGGRKDRLHPATKAFMALRIAVNRELSSLEGGLAAGLGLVAPGGRMAVIAFHSNEDRLVKKFFATHAGRWESLAEGGSAWRGEEPKVALVNRKPLVAGNEETSRNPRARSAKLRAAERVG